MWRARGLSVLASLAVAASVAPAGPAVISLRLPSGKVLQSEVMVKDEDRAMGLMFRPSLPSDRGMLFVFDQPDFHGIWMKNCKFPIDIVWLDERRRVVVRTGIATRVDVRLGPGEDVAMPAIEVEGRYDLIQPESSTSRHILRGDDVRSIPIDDVLEAIKLTPGVVAAGGELHFRGGRSGEVLYQLDGIPVRDPLHTEPFSISTVASSTRMPTANARPPRVITFSEWPSRNRMPIDDRIAKGIETATISVLRHEPRNTRIIVAVSSPAMMLSTTTPSIAAVTNKD